MKNYPKNMDSCNDDGAWFEQKTARLDQRNYQRRRPAVESVALFGSRATGTYKSYSDIDLVLYGKLDEATLDRLWTCFQESSLPYKVDVKAYEMIHHPPLKEHIDRFARPLF